MEYRNLGRTGLKVSTICLGTMQFGWTVDEKGSHRVLDQALANGCNFIDTADVYSRWHEPNQGGESEQIIGSWLAQGHIRRSEVVIATKVRGRMGEGPNDAGLSRKHIMDAIEQSLRRLQTDYIDLYQTHSPDHETPLEETLRALDDLQRAGKIRYAGCSNYPAWLLAKSLWISDVKGLCRFDSLQPHFNYLHRSEFERELQPLSLDQGIGVIPYSPLAGGFLTGKYRADRPLPESARVAGVQRRYFNERGFVALRAIEEMGKSYGATPAQMAIAWLVANPAVTSAIIGANNTEQLEETMKGAEVKLSDSDKQELDAVTQF